MAAALGWLVGSYRAELPADVKPLGAQDSLSLAVVNGVLAAAVADGHGDPKHARSRRGADLACQVAVDVGVDAVESLMSSESRAHGQQVVSEMVPREITRQWARRVLKDFEERPVSPRELEIVGTTLDAWHQHLGLSEDGELPTGVDASFLARRRKLYGTTLLSFVTSETVTAAWQIGDGLVVLIDADGEHHLPLEDESAALGDSTESLSTDRAEDLFRSAVWWESAVRIDFVALFTDGLEKAYSQLDPLLGTLRKVHQAAKDCDEEEATGLLEMAASRLARAGSETTKDDASVILLQRYRRRGAPS